VSQENVEIVRSSLQAYNAGDMKAWSALLDPEVVWAAFEGWPEAEMLVGREACQRQWQRMRAPFDADTVEPVADLIAVGDRVVVSAAWHATGQGPEVNMQITTVYTVREGKIIRMQNFWSRADALKAAGLEQ
jgi:ketosteroid isomerase-like protein